VTAWLTAELDPDRDAVALTAAPPGTTGLLELWREGPSGVRAYVRGYGPPGGVYTPPAALVVRDYEAPLGLPLVYGASAYTGTGGHVGDADTVTITVPAGAADWLVDLARPLNSRRILVESFAELAHDTPSGVHRVINRRSPIVTQDLAWTFAARLVFATLELADRDACNDALGNGVPVLLRTPPAHGVGNVYLAPLRWVEARPSRVAQHTPRRFDVDVVQVDRPDPTLYTPQAPGTYETLAATFATYAELLAERDTYDAVLYDYAAGAGPVAPWPPSDV
jgi:hypothetical protein